MMNPMSTAPRDGTVIDLWTKYGRLAEASWTGQEWCSLIADLHGRDEAFVGWTPIPELDDRTRGQFYCWRESMKIGKEDIPRDRVLEAIERLL